MQSFVTKENEMIPFYEKFYRIGSPIEFQLNSREVVGIVHEINYRRNEHERCLYYEVEYEGKLYDVDGELFQVIKS